MDKPLFDCGNLIKEYELAIWELFLGVRVPGCSY